MSPDSEQVSVYECNETGVIRTKGETVPGFTTSYICEGGAKSMVRTSLGDGWHFQSNRCCYAKNITWYELYDACAANLMRPAMYGAYHHITVLGKEDAPCTQLYDVTGGLCENNDKFAIDRMLPPVENGDLLYIHDTGAHGFSMGYNYNGKLRSAELLLCEDGIVKMIRRAETPADYFATFDFRDILDKYRK